MNYNELLETAKDNLIIFDSFVKAESVLKNHDNIVVSISGGSDSDIVLDLIYRVNDATTKKHVHYVFFDTGLEYQATKNHLKYLEDKYGIEIERERAIKPIPTSAREYGQPFLNKYVSEQMMRLQKYNFKWEDKTYEELAVEYPKCKSSVKWWCNQYTVENGFKNKSRFDIGYNKWLREFILKNPPTFKIANKCCKYAKKNVSKEITKRYGADLLVIGIRQAEGGIRATAYKSCYSNNGDKTDMYRPIFWYTNQDKIDYENLFGVVHSACYTEYGMTRTGCAGCPYNRKIKDELHIIGDYEPKLHKAVNKIFSDSYEYTRQYREFAAAMEAQENGKQIDGQMNIYDYL